MSSSSTRFGKAIIYGITIVPLLVTLGFYFLEHVPEREEYFLNLRFRTLAVVGKQIETKLESQSSGLTYGRLFERITQMGPSGPIQMPFTDYVRAVFPGLERTEKASAAAAPQKAAEKAVDQTSETARPNAADLDPEIEFPEAADRVRFTTALQEQRWEGSLRRLILPLTQEPSFDDLLLAKKEGAVLFQRSNSTPKVGNVSPLIKKQETKDTGILATFHQLYSDGSGYDTDLLRHVDLDGSQYHVFAQPLTIRAPRSVQGKPQDLLLCGLVRSQRLRQEAMDVPPRYLVWIIVPLLIGLLSGPFLKLVLMRRTGRFESRDLPLLTVFSCLAMAMLMVVLLAYHLNVEDRARVRSRLEGMAARLDRQLCASFENGRRLLRAIDAFAASKDADTARPQAQNRVRIWSWDELSRAVKDIRRTDFEFVYWTSNSGLQIEKWTPLETNTPFYPQKDSEHFTLAATGQYWRDRNDLAAPFTGDLLISPTTSDPIAVVTIESKRSAELELGPDRRKADPHAPEKLKAAFISLVATPRSLLVPVIPPGSGYAVVRSDGSVIYHSRRERILNENLFQETDSPALAAAVAAQTPGVLQGRYRGSDVMFYVRPVSEIAGIPWTLVVFQEMKPLQTLGGQVCLDVLVLYLVLWLGPALVMLSALLNIKMRGKCSWRSGRIRALRYFWPDERGAHTYLALVRIECGLIVLFLALLVWFSRHPSGIAGILLLVAAFTFPVGCVATWVWQLRSPGSVTATESWRQVYVAALCLGLVISSLLPVSAFFQLSLRLESDIGLRRWQAELADGVLKHRSEVVAGIRESQNMAPATMDTALKLALPPTESGLCDDEQLYGAFDNTDVHCAKAPLPEPAEPVWKTALIALRTKAPGGLEAAGVTVRDLTGILRAGTYRTDDPVLALLPPAGGTGVASSEASLVVKSTLVPTPYPPGAASWWLLLAALLAASCIWVWSAASRLFLFNFHQIPLRTLKSLPPAKRLKHPILVLGLPRSGKDSAVKAYIQQHAERVDLKADKLDEAWLDQTLARLGIPAEANQAAPPQAAAAAAGIATSGAPQMAGVARGPLLEEAKPPATDVHEEDGTAPKWIHITNLEASLYDRGRRDIAMRLLDTLLRVPFGRAPKIVVTSVVDPVFHFESIFPDRDREVERDPLPETEFGRYAHNFLAFERVLAVEDQPPPEWAKEDWGQALWKECHHHRWLRRIGANLADEIRQRVERGEGAPPPDVLVEELCEKAFALYELFWSACTRPEKLMLVQLAQTGLVNPRAKNTLHELIRKGLVMMAPYPRIMNESFTRFLDTAAKPEQIAAWEKEEGENSWLIVRNVLIILVIFTLLMIGISQDHALQAISGILTAVAGAIGGSFKLVDMVSQKFGKSNAGAAG